MDFMSENNDFIDNFLTTFFNNFFGYLNVDKVFRIRFIVLLFILKHNNLLRLFYKRRLR